MASTTFTSTSHNHDRLPDTDEAIMSARVSMPAVGVGGSGGGSGGGDDEPIPDITASQKMISAMSGSLFTSLLGETILTFASFLYSPSDLMS